MPNTYVLLFIQYLLAISWHGNKVLRVQEGILAKAVFQANR